MQPLEALGLVVRAARLNKQLTQQRAAKVAGVSRKQWALLEQGHNVSGVFIQKVAASLGLDLIPLGDGLEATTTGARSADLVELLRLADDLSALAERLRAFAIDAAVPAADRDDDTTAIATFVAARAEQLAPDDTPRLNRTFRRLAVAAPATREMSETAQSAAKRSVARRQKKQAGRK